MSLYQHTFSLFCHTFIRMHRYVTHRFYLLLWLSILPASFENIYTRVFIKYPRHFTCLSRFFVYFFVQFLFSIKFTCTYVQFMLFGIFVGKSTTLSLHNSSSSLKRLSTIHSHIGGQMLHSISKLFSLFSSEIFLSRNTLLSHQKIFFVIPLHLRFSISHFPFLSCYTTQKS